jgi:hypothetical protein
MPIDTATLTPEKISELAQIAIRMTAPTFYASNVFIQWAGNDGVLIFGRAQPATLPPLGELAPFALPEHVALIHMSSSTLKDLSVLLSLQMAEYEKKLGRVIETDFTRSLAKG